MLVGDLPTINARRIPDREGLIWGNERITWAQLNSRVNRLANSLIDMGVQPGSRVAFLLNNGKELVELCYAIAKIGCAFAPIMPRSVGREVAYIVNNIEASALFVGSQHASVVEEVRREMHSLGSVVGVGDGHPFKADYEELVGKSPDKEPSIRIDPDSICAILHTSGTTGSPKGCILRHRPVVMNLLRSLRHIPSNEDDRGLLFMPLSMGLSNMLLHEYALRGIPTVLLPNFEETEVLKAIEREKVTLNVVVEAPFDRLVVHPDLDRYDLGSIRYWWATSATRDAREGINRIRKVKSFRGRFWNAYGSTEGGSFVSFCSPDAVERALEDPDFGHIFKSVGQEAILNRIDCVGDDGVPVPQGEIGEMVIRGPGIFGGYWKQPEETRKVLHDGQLWTGDLARKDKNGFIFLEGRKRDMIKSGGINVYPAEIEEILRGHSKVLEVAAVGVPDERWGERVVACVVRRNPCTEEELLDYCATRLAGYKKPKSIVFVDGLPKSNAGKILKRELREMLIGK